MKKNELTRIESMFLWSEGDYGTIEFPTKKGFIEISKLGNATWNAWRRRYPEATADFSGTDFEIEKINFSGFDFRTQDKLDEKDCVDFSNCKFGISSDFSRCTFGDRCNFSNAKFGAFAIFYKAKFGRHANFTNAHFDNCPYFQESEFDMFADFSDATFGQASNFEGASFDDHAYFCGATFLGWSDFSAHLDTESTEKMSTFNSVDFSGATFTGNVKFTGRSFLSTTNFGQRTGTIDTKRSNMAHGKATGFLAIPNFHGCKFHQDTSFDNAEFLAPPSPQAARAYRTLKLAMEQLKATREEQRFFRLEMKAEHPSLKFWPRLMSAIYATTSDYGFSLLRPIITLLCVTIMIGLIHGGLANAEASKWQAVLPSADFEIDRTLQWLRFVAINTLPVPGFDKTQMELRDALFGKDGAIVSIAMGLEMIHKVISLGCVFLLGLALRNLFKMKS